MAAYSNFFGLHVGYVYVTIFNITGIYLLSFGKLDRVRIVTAVFVYFYRRHSSAPAIISRIWFEQNTQLKKNQNSNFNYLIDYFPNEIFKNRANFLLNFLKLDQLKVKESGTLQFSTRFLVLNL